MIVPHCLLNLGGLSRAVVEPPNPPDPSTMLCADEDIAVRCPGDFVALCPAWQELVAGDDGSFAADAPWTLTSGAVDFLGAGLAVGHVVILDGPRPTFAGSGVLFGIEAVAHWSLTLRRLGAGARYGRPPGPSAGIAGVSFRVRTLQPQIEIATQDVRETVGLDEAMPGRTLADAYDPHHVLRQLTVLTVLQRQYAMEVRTDRGDFAIKLRQVESDLAAARSRLTLRWGSTGEAEAATTVFATQVRR